jgi:hypothetical protein
MKTNFKNTSLLFIVGILLMGCASPSPVPVPVPPCSSTNTIFNQLYTNVTMLPGHQNTTTFDTEIHEYTFQFSQNKTICSIGYQSQPAIASTPYLMEIIDNNTNTVIYSGNHIFSSANTSYVSITPTPIIANQSYTIRRTILLTNAGNNFANIIGRVVNQPGALVSFPQSFGIMTITGANFHQNGGPLLNRGIPYIDFGYY